MAAPWPDATGRNVEQELQLRTGNSSGFADNPATSAADLESFLVPVSGAGNIAAASVADLNTTVSDRFARGDSASSLGIATSLQAWTAHTGTWGISGGRAYCPTPSGDSVATFDCGLSNVDVSVDIWAGTSDSGLVARAADANNYILLMLNSAASQVQLWKRVSGSYTTLGSLTIVNTLHRRYNLRLRCNGTSISGYVDGQLVATVTDSAGSSNTRIGLRQNSAGASRWQNIVAYAYSGSMVRRVAQWSGDGYTPGLLNTDTLSARAFIGYGNPAKEGATLSAGDQWMRQSALPGRKRIQIILDTDASSDVDDVFDFKAALTYHAEGICQLLGTAVTTSRAKSPGALDAVAKYYGFSGLPFASYAPLGTFDPGAPAVAYDTLYDTYSHDVGLAATCLDSTAGIWNWLTNSAGPVTYIMTGLARGLVHFLTSSTDAAALFASKVTKVVAVAGKYPSDGGSPEWNLHNDIASWVWLAANCPVPIHWVGIEIGDAVGAVGTYMSVVRPESDPVRVALATWGASRTPWGVVGIAYAIEDMRYFSSIVQGNNAINSATGANTFTAGAGTHFYLTSTLTAQLARHHERLIAADCQVGTVAWSGMNWA